MMYLEALSMRKLNAIRIEKNRGAIRHLDLRATKYAVKIPNRITDRGRIFGQAI
jgi:hypothetical protein